MTRDEQKELLILACRADRLAWRQACRPLPATPMQRASEVLRALEPLRPLIPGKMGSLMRGAGFLAGLAGRFGGFGT